MLADWPWAWPGSSGRGAAMPWPRSRHKILTWLRGNACPVFPAARTAAKEAIAWRPFPGQAIAVRRAAPERNGKLAWPGDVRLQRARRSFPVSVAVASRPTLKAKRNLPNTPARPQISHDADTSLPTLGSEAADSVNTDNADGRPANS